MQQHNVPKCVVLETPAGEHLGFVLFAVEDGALRGECIFRVLPPNTAIWSTPLVQSLFARKDLGESNVQITPGSSASMYITSTDLADFVIELNEVGQGMWRELPPGTHHGRAAAVRAS